MHHMGGSYLPMASLAASEREKQCAAGVSSPVDDILRQQTEPLALVLHDHLCSPM